MAGAESRYGILIEAKYQAATAFSQATQDVRRLNAELKQLQPSLNGNAQANLKYAETFIALHEARQRLRESQNVLLGNAGAAKDMGAAMGALGGAVRQVGNAVSVLNPQLGGLVSGIETVLGAGAGLGGVVAASTAALAGMGVASLLAAKGIGDYQQHVDNVKQTLGVTSTEFGGLTVAAVNANKSFEQIEPSLDMFVRKLGEAREGSKEAADAFKGIDINQSTGAVLQDVATKLNGIKDPAERAAQAGKFFSRQWHEVLPVISQDMKASSDEAVAWSVTLSGSAEAAARKTNLAFDKLALRWKGFMNQMSSDQAKSGEDWAKWATGTIDWLSKIQHKLSEKYELNMTLKEGGTPALKTHLQDFFSHFGETEKPEAGSTAPTHALNEEQQKQLAQLDALIAGKERLRQANRLTLEDEITELQKLADQAIAMEDQVVGAKELLRIRRELNHLATTGPLSQQDRDFIEWLKTAKLGTNGLTVTPTFKSELLTPQYEQGGGIEPWRVTPSKSEMGGWEPEKVEGWEPIRFNDMKDGLLGKDFLKNGEEANKNLKIYHDLLKKNFDFQKMSQEVLAQGMNKFFTDAFADFKHLGDAVKNLVVGVIEQIAAQTASNFFLKALGITAGVAATVATGGGAGPVILVQHGGQWTGAQGGLAIAGTRGKDNIPVMMGKGEGIFDHSIMDRMRSFLSAPGEYIRGRDAGALAGINGVTATPVREAVQSAAARSTPAPREEAAPIVNVHLTVNTVSLDRHALQDHVKNDLMPLIGEAVRSGGYRRGR